MGEAEKKEENSPEQKKEEKTGEKKEEQTEQKKEEEAKQDSACVLFVDLHCVGCAKKIQRSILKIKGVEGVTIDMAKNEVTIKGAVDGQSMCGIITQKTKRRAKVLSPLPKAEGEPVEEVVAQQVTRLSTVELNVNMHCEACAEQLKRKILKMKGVRTAETELSSSKVTVTGTMDADRLVAYVYRHTRKQAKIVSGKEPEEKPKPDEEKVKEEEREKPMSPADQEKPKAEETKEPPQQEEKNEGDGGGGNAAAEHAGEEVERNSNEEEQYVHKMMYHYNYQPFYVIERIPAPQLFSDENPNACCIV